jgi:hypothetical protein
VATSHADNPAGPDSFRAVGWQDTTTEYGKALTRSWALTVAGVLGFLLSAFLGFVTDSQWLISLGIGLSALFVAQFLAWRDVRNQRNAATDDAAALHEQIRVRDEREDVRLRFVVPSGAPEVIASERESYNKLIVQVWNDGATSRFAARVTTTISGVVVRTLIPDYGLGNKLAWEDELAPDVRISQGHFAYLILGMVDPARSKVSFLGPAGAYVQNGYTYANVEATGDEIEFDLEVRDLDVDVARVAHVRFHLDGAHGRVYHWVTPVEASTSSPTGTAPPVSAP